MIFVRREADNVIGIALSQEIDLVQLQFAVLRRIDRNAMIERKGNVPTIEKRNEVVHIAKRSAPRRSDYRLTGLRYLLDENPVIAVRAGNLENRNAELTAEIDRAFIKRRRQRQASSVANSLRAVSGFASNSLLAAGSDLDPKLVRMKLPN